MTNTVSSAMHGAENFVSPITNMFARMFTLPSMTPNVQLPSPSTTSTQIPAQQPATMRPQPQSMQQSFLSGAASAALPGGGAPNSGKTLLGS